MVAATALEAQDDTRGNMGRLAGATKRPQFTDHPVPDEALDRILEAVRRAPSAGNWQPWDFLLVTDRAQLVELAKVWQGARHVAGAAAAIAVAPQPQDDHHLEVRDRAVLEVSFG